MRRLLAVFVFAVIASWGSHVMAVDAAGWPFERPAEILLGFGQSYIGATGGSSTHRGVDLAADAGSQVRAVLAGTVTFAGSVPAGEGSTMRAVTVESGDVRLSYMPLSSFAILVGDQVEAGAVLGPLAQAGDASSSASHLHIGARIGTLYVDPMQYLAPVLPPLPPQPVPVPAEAPAPVATPVPAVVGVPEAIVSGAPAQVFSAATGGVVAQTHVGVPVAAQVPAAAPAGGMAPAPFIDSGQAIAVRSATPSTAHTMADAASVYARPSAPMVPGTAACLPVRSLQTNVQRVDGGAIASEPTGVESHTARTVDRVPFKVAFIVLAGLCGAASLWPVWRTPGVSETGIGAFSEDVAAVGVR